MCQNSPCRAILNALRQELLIRITLRSLLWDQLPFPIDVTTWSNYWMLLADFVNTYSDCHMYVRDVVVPPVDVTHEMRMIVYMLIHNTLFALFDLVETMSFRQFFWKDEAATFVDIRRLTLLPHSGGPTIYPEDNEWVQD